MSSRVRSARPGVRPLNTILACALVVALAEIGDRTMLLAIVLAIRFRAPWRVIAGIFAATLANHALAAVVGVEAAWLLDGFWFRLAVALGFLAMAAWTLVPDTLADDAEPRAGRHGAFLTTLVCFFLVEIGDKTQIATMALAAHYRSVPLVAAGTTLGMLAANIPAVFLGERITRVVPLVWIRRAAAALLAVLGILALVRLFS